MDYIPPSIAVIDVDGGTLKNGYTWPSGPVTGMQAMSDIAPYNRCCTGSEWRHK
jgi:hypothetical protein